MTTPNIVPRFNEEGRVGRAGRRFIEIHAKTNFIDTLSLNLPSGESIIQNTTQSYSFDLTQGALYYPSIEALRSVHGASLSESDPNVIMYDPTTSGLFDSVTGQTVTTGGWPEASLSAAQFASLVAAVEADANFSNTMPISGAQLFLHGVSVQAFPPQNHLYYKGGRLCQGDKTFAWTEEVDTIKVLVDSLLGSGADGLSTLTNVITELSSLPLGLDSFVELANQVEVIAADYVTAASISAIGDITALNTKVTTLEGDTTSLQTSVNTNTAAVAGHSGTLATLQTNQGALLNFQAGADNLYTLKGEAGVTEIVAALAGTNLTTLSGLLTGTGIGTSAKLALDSSVLVKDASDFQANFAANIVVSNFSTNVALTAALDSKLAESALDTSLTTLFTNNDTLRTSLNFAKKDVLEAGLANTNSLIGGNSALLANKVDDSAIAGLVSSGIGVALADSSSGLATQLSAKLSGATLPGAIDTVLNDSSSGLATQLSGKLSTGTAFDTAFNTASTSAGFTTLTAVAGAGYQTGTEVDSKITAGTSSFLATSSLATEFTSLLTASNLATSGSLGTLTSAIKETSQDVSMQALNAVGLSAGLTIDWSGYTLDVSTLNIVSNFTFQCADPNIELNVGNPTSYLNQVAGGITWVRADDTYNSSILWDETNKYFHVRLAGSDTYRLLTIQDLTSLQNEISNVSSTQSNAVQAVQSNLDQIESSINQAISTESSGRLSSDTALQAAIDTEIVLRTNAITSVQALIDSESASRIASDTTIQSNITSEQSARSVADTQLSNTISDLEDKVDANSSTLTSSISSLESATNTKIASDISTSATAINSRVDSEIQSVASTLDTRISTEVSVLEAADTANKQELEQSISTLTTTVTQHISASNPYNITKDTVGLDSVKNIDVESWEGSNSITSVGAISSGTWSATPISSIADSAVKPSHIDSSETAAYTVQNLNVLGQLNVSGDAVQVTTNEVNIGDNIIRLNADVAGTPSENSGIEVERGTEDNVSMLWDEGNDRWSIGDGALETSGLSSAGTITLDSQNVHITTRLSVPHIEITSNQSFDVNSSIIAINTDAREPSYPSFGTKSGGGNASKFDDLYDSNGNLTGTLATTDTVQADNDSGLKVILGGGFTGHTGANGPKYAFMYWDASESSWRLSESCGTTAENNTSTSQRTEIVDTSIDNHYDLLHAGHIGGSLQTGNVTAAQVQAYDADLQSIADITGTVNDDFLVRSGGAWVKKTKAEVKTILDVTAGAVLTAGDQTIAGAKTFSTTIVGDISGNAATVNSLTIQTAVPANAIFTTNDFTTTLKNKLEGISAGAEVNRTLGQLNNLSLDATTVSGFSIGVSVPANAVFTDTTYSVGGGGLTQNNFTNTLKTKLDGIDTGANVNRTQAELNALALDATTVSGFSVGVSVPANAVFTDTNTTYSVGDGGLTQNNFTDTLKTKLDGIAASADVNRTLAELNALALDATTVSGFSVGVAVPANAVFTDTNTTYSVGDGGLTQNNFTDTLKTKLDGIAASADVNRTLAELNALALDATTVSGFSVGVSVPANAVFTDTDTTYSVGDGGLTQNNFTDTLKTKLDGIEASADVNRTLVELNALDLDATTVSGFSVGVAVPANAVFTDTDTTYSVGDGGLTQNNFTDTLKTKLDGIEASADVNRTLAELNALALDATTVSGFSVGVAVPANAVFTDTDTTYSVGDGGLTQNNFTDTLKTKLDGIATGATKITEGTGVSISGEGALSISADQSSAITKINVASLFAQGSSWDGSTSTGGGDTTKSITLGYTTDSHAGPWNVKRQTKRDGSDLAYMDVSYKVSSGVDQYKSLPDLNFTLTSSSSGGDTTHLLTLA
jgi:hypothetical protein